jgi:adenylate kinase
VADAAPTAGGVARPTMAAAGANTSPAGQSAPAGRAADVERTIVVLLGPPGAGKGTQGEQLAAALGIPKVATGDVLRAAVRDGTSLGQEAQAFMERGDLVPDPVILGIMKEALSQPATVRGAILDGVIRTVPQAEGLQAVLEQLGRVTTVVLVFAIDDDVLVRRISERTVCEACQTPYTGHHTGTACPKCGGRLVRRSDDEPTAVRQRLAVYHAQTAPVITWYKTHGVRVVSIDAVGTRAEVQARVLRAFSR